MKILSPIVLLILALLFSCKQNSSVTNKESTEEATTQVTEKKENNLPVKESIFITMERTPCYGKCPIYSVTIFNTGKVNYNGENFVKKKGKHTAQLTPEQLEELKSKIKSIDLFNLNNKYDHEVTDIPSCILSVQLDGKKKKIVDRYGAPKGLKDFESLIDAFVITDQLTAVEE